MLMSAIVLFSFGTAQAVLLYMIKTLELNHKFLECSCGTMLCKGKLNDFISNAYIKAKSTVSVQIVQWKESRL